MGPGPLARRCSFAIGSPPCTTSQLDTSADTHHVMPPRETVYAEKLWVKLTSTLPRKIPSLH